MKVGWSVGIAAAALSAALLAPGPAAAGTAGETVGHAVRAGDNLHLIAGYYYRDPRQWKKVWKLNQKSVRRPSLLVPGKVLQVEVVPGTTWEIAYEEFLARAAGK